MPKICYVPKRFTEAHQQVIDTARAILEEWAAQGYDMTLRQLYYQFVARDLLPNRQTEYKRLGNILNDARLAGEIDWGSMVDRTRNLKGNAHWSSPANIVQACAEQFRYDLWADQGLTVEVWIEKEALVGVIERVCTELDVGYFACRGYNSQSEQWRAARRMSSGRHVVLHLGDHDPSGLDMTEDIRRRFDVFGANAEVKRLALNMDQVEEYGPPPNPAKITDSRAMAYIAEHGAESWELDALDPSTINQLIEDEVLHLRNEEKWQAALKRQQAAREAIQAVADNWDTVDWITALDLWDTVEAEYGGPPDA